MDRSIMIKIIAVTCAIVMVVPTAVFAKLPVDEHNNLTKDVDLIAENEFINSTNGHNVGTNNGRITVVSEKSTVTTNNNDVTTNNGTIETNVADADVTINYGTVGSNAGTINRNYADIVNDGGTVKTNYAGAKVTNNSGTVEANLHNSDGSAGTVTGKSAAKEMYEIKSDSSYKGDEWEDMKASGSTSSYIVEQLPDWKVWLWEDGYINISARDHRKMIINIGSSDHPKNISKQGKGVWRIKGLNDIITLTDITIADNPDPSPEPDHNDDDAEEVKPAVVNPDTVEGYFAVNGQPLYGVAMGKTIQGAAAQAVFSASRPAGWQEALTFNMAINGKVEYTVKNGVLTIIIPKEFPTAGRTFAVMALDKNGRAWICSDTDTNPATVTAAINVEGYAFALIYK